MPIKHCRPVIAQASSISTHCCSLSCSRELKNDKVAATEEREVERGWLHFEQKSTRFSLIKATVLMVLCSKSTSYCNDEGCLPEQDGKIGDRVQHSHAKQSLLTV